MGTTKIELREGVDGSTPSRPAPMQSPTWRRLTRLVGGSAITVIPVVALLLLVVYPLAAIIIQSVFPNLFSIQPDATFSLSSLQQVFASRESYRAVAASVTLALITCFGAVIIGTGLAVLARRTNVPGASLIDVFVWIVFFTPSFLLGEAWTVLMFKGGTLDHYFHLPEWLINTFFSPVGVALLLILKNFPFVYLALTAALSWLGSEYEEAARVQGAPLWWAWLRINLPLLLPAILSGALIVFAEALSDFGTAVTIAQNASVTLVTYQIYSAINTFPVDFSQAAALSLLLFGAIALALIGQARLLRARAYQIVSGRTRPSTRIDLGVWKWPALAAVLLVAMLALLLPLAECVALSLEHTYANGLASTNLTVRNYQLVLARGGDDISSLWTSLRLAVVTATLVLFAGLVIAFLIARTQITGRRLLSFVALVTISVPGIILACGYIFAWNSPYLQNLGIGGRGQPRFYGTIWILLAAYIGGNLPYAIRLNMGALEQIGDSLLDAARVQGAGIGAVLARVVAPILRAGLINIWLLVFTGTIFELAASELLYPPGQPTMPVRITGYFGTFRVEQGMALAMLNIGVVALLVIVLRSAPALWRRVREYAGQEVRA
jgi:iron(III) transport system permease protein